MKIRLIIALALLLSSINFVQPANAHSIIFRESFEIAPSGNYCDLTQVTFAYDYTRYFSFDAYFTYYIVVETFDASGALLNDSTWATTGWMPSGSDTTSGLFGVNFANEHLRLDRQAAFYHVNYGYSYTWDEQTVLEWNIDISCDVANNTTYDAQFNLTYAPYN